MSGKLNFNRMLTVLALSAAIGGASGAAQAAPVQFQTDLAPVTAPKPRPVATPASTPQPSAPAKTEASTERPAPYIKPRPVPAAVPYPKTPVENDLFVGQPIGPLMLKNAEQILLLNSLATADMSLWTVVLKRNHAILDDEFISVMGNRSEDAMRKAVTSFTSVRQLNGQIDKANAAHDSQTAARLTEQRNRAERASSGYVEISFRYALLGDLAAAEIHRPDTCRIKLAERYMASPNGAHMALAIVGNILVTDKDNYEALALSARIRSKIGDYYGAMTQYEKVLRRNPNNAEAWTAIGKAHLLVSDFRKAKDALRNAVACTSGGSTEEAKQLLDKLDHPQQLPPPSDPSITPLGVDTTADAAEAVLLTAEEAMQASRLEEARKAFERVVMLRPTDARPHIRLGDLYFRQSDFLKAIDEYNTATKLSPANPLPLRYLGLACEKVYDSTKSPQYLERALECIASAIRIKADYAEARTDQERLLAKKSAEMPH